MFVPVWKRSKNRWILKLSILPQNQWIQNKGKTKGNVNRGRTKYIHHEKKRVPNITQEKERNQIITLAHPIYCDFPLFFEKKYRGLSRRVESQVYVGLCCTNACLLQFSLFIWYAMGERRAKCRTPISGIVFLYVMDHVNRKKLGLHWTQCLKS